jgi:3-hydroxyacyl-CoA dehydrogenase/enoyl-CoA hydratase/3-hydroxybutyryl-CoA epimerase
MRKHFSLVVDADGIALVTMDSPGRSMNVIAPEVEHELGAILEQTTNDPAVRGVATLCIGGGEATAVAVELV